MSVLRRLEKFEERVYSRLGEAYGRAGNSTRASNIRFKNSISLKACEFDGLPGLLN